MLARARYCTWLVTVALSLLTEFLESMESQLRARESRAQRILLEEYFEGVPLNDDAIERAIELSVSGAWRCMVVIRGALWCMVVHGGAWWCMVVHGGAWQSIHSQGIVPAWIAAPT
jgi:hypothetical protein